MSSNVQGAFFLCCYSIYWVSLFLLGPEYPNSIMRVCGSFDVCLLNHTTKMSPNTNIISSVNISVKVKSYLHLKCFILSGPKWNARKRPRMQNHTSKNLWMRLCYTWRSNGQKLFQSVHWRNQQQSIKSWEERYFDFYNVNMFLDINL